MEKPFISICIPAYNRPDKLHALLSTIDAKNPREIEIVVSEDFSPKRSEIRDVVSRFRAKSKYKVVYRENAENLREDKNLKELVRVSSGEWIMLMGDDDELVPGALDKLIPFIRKNKDIVYVLRRYEVIHEDGSVEDFRYYIGDRTFEPGEKTYEELFRKSVFMSGFTIKRESILPYLIDEFDGRALIQIYWVAEVVQKNLSAYFDEPLARQNEDTAYIAKEVLYSNKNKKIIPRPVNLSRSLDFLSGYAKIAEFMDKKYGFHSLPIIMSDLSKYSYPSLSIHRNKGVRVFLEYVRELNKLGFNASPYYYLYVVLLLLLGKRACDWGIVLIKRILSKTPQL
ncbi:MAG: glycosyltransferase family 2 protein [Candidatus Jorgensenbacteria bacterium]